MRKIKAGALLGAFITLTACAGGDDAATDQQTAPVGTGDAATGAAPAVNVPLPEGVTAEMVAQGQQIFNSGICWSCHQQNGVGGPLGPALNDNTWINVPSGTYDEIVQIINSGVPQPKEHPGPMPAKGGAPLSEDEVRAVAAYVFSISRGG